MKLKPIILYDRYVPATAKYEVFQEHANVYEIIPAVIFYAWYGRNAWYSSWVQIYEKYRFFTKVEESKAWIESKRVQGSVWHITQLPALCLNLNNDCQLWLCSVNIKDWWESDLFDHKGLTDVFKKGCFNTANCKNFIKDGRKLLAFKSESFSAGVKDTVERLKPPKECLSWEAVSSGRGYQLEWVNNDKIHHDYKTLKNFISRFQRYAKRYCVFGENDFCVPYCNYLEANKKCSYMQNKYRQQMHELARFLEY